MAEVIVTVRLATWGGIAALGWAAAALAEPADPAAGLAEATQVAEQVFARLPTADPAERRRVFVMDLGDGGLAAVPAGGEPIVVGRLVDAIGGDARDVDLLVAPSAVGRVSELAEDAMPRLHLAAADGPVLPLRPGPDGAEVALGEALWLTVGDDPDLDAITTILDVLQRRVDPDTTEVAVVDADCVGLAESADDVGAAAARSNAGDTVVVVVDGALTEVEDAIELAGVHNVALVLLAGDACGDGASVPPEALVDALTVGTVRDLWRWGAADGRLLDQAGVLDGRLAVSGASLVAIHPLPTRVDARPLVATGWALGTGDLARWVWGLFGVFAVACTSAFGGLIYLGLKPRR